MSRQRSALALYARALRTGRDMTQESLAEASGMHISTIKNLEADRHIAPDTAVQIFESGFAKAATPLTEDERQQLIAYWLQRSFPAIQLPALGKIVRSAEQAASAADHQLRKMLEGLDTADTTLLLTIAQRLGKKDGAKIRAVLRAVAAL